MPSSAKHYVFASAVAILGLAALAFAWFYKQQPALRVLCGSSMATPIQEVQRLFEAEHGRIAVDLGGSETLLPRVLEGAPADVFVCHDPFEQKVRDAGLLADSVVVGVLRPVLLVAPGNPRGLHSVEDLTKEGLRLGIGDPRYSTCGEMFVGLLRRKKIYDAVMKNVVFQGRSHGEIADGLLVGKLDAIVVWNFIARLYRDKLELVPTADEYPRVRVLVLGLRQSGHPERRDAFLDLCRSEQVQEIFRRQGYVSGE